MLTLLSPAKTLDFSPVSNGLPTTTPQLEQDISVLMKRCKKLGVRTLRKIMDLSEPLAELNHQRFQEMSLPFTSENSKPALLAFQGDVYKGLDAGSLPKKSLKWAQNHLRILSGFYGILRPLDLMQPYRLEMGTKIGNTRGKNLYQFWGNRLANAINTEIADHKEPTILNLASNEYFKAVPKKALEPRLLTADFKEIRDGKPRTISFFAKKARGQMARFIVDQRIDEPEGLKDFTEDGYAFNPDLSQPDRWIFSRG